MIYFNSRVALLLSLIFSLSACGGGSGGSGSGDSGSTESTEPVNKVAVLGDYADDRIAEYLRSKGHNVDNFRSVEQIRSEVLNNQYAAWLKLKSSASGNFIYDVQLYNILTGDLSTLAVPETYKRGLQINNQSLVWQQTTATENQIVAYNLSTGELTTLSSYPFPGQEQDFLQAYDDYVLWRDYRSSDALYIYNLSTGIEKLIMPINHTRATTRPIYKASGDYVAIQSDTDIYLYQISIDNLTQLTNDLAPQYQPDIDGDWIVWEAETVAGNRDINYYNISSATLTNAVIAGNQQDPIIDNNLIVYRDNDTLSGIDLSGLSFFNIRLDTPQINIQDSSYQISGDYVYWREIDTTLAPQAQIYAYHIPSATITRLTEGYSDQRTLLANSDTQVLMGVFDNGYKNIELMNTSTRSLTRISAPSQAMTLAANITDYELIVFAGDHSNESINVFNSANSEGINILSLGSDFNGFTIFSLPSIAALFALTPDYNAYIAPVSISVATDELTHPIFSGVDTSMVISFESDTAVSMDEQTYVLDPSNPLSPGDWNVLATFGPPSGFSGRTAIVEFTTNSGSRIIIDGSANNSDRYEYWTSDRWTVLNNEVEYLLP